MEYPKTKTQRRFKRLANIIITELAELSEAQMVEVRTIVGNMYMERYEASMRADDASRARASKYKGGHSK